MKLGYRLLAVDIDGMLKVPGESISSVVFKSLKACIEKGVLVVPATGKKLSSIESICSDLGLKGEVITCNGSLVFRFPEKELLSCSFLDSASADVILADLAEDQRVSLAVFTVEDIVSTEGSYASEVLARIGEPTTLVVPRLAEISPHQIAKVLAAVKPDESIARVYGQYHSRYYSLCSITITSDAFVEFMAPGVSKGKALATICDARRINRSRIIALGDSDNDLSMFDVAGLSVAVANCTEKVAEAADLIVASAAENGVAAAVRQLILDRD